MKNYKIDKLGFVELKKVLFYESLYKRMKR